MIDAKAVKKTMTAGIENGEWFDIIYHGGSNPGAKRRIVPLAILNDRVRAKCYTSNAVKPFMFAKIEILTSDEKIAETDVWQAAPPLEPFSDIKDAKDLHGRFCDILADKGWSVELHEREFGNSIALYGYWKNGNAKKTPKHWISFEHTTYQSDYDSAGNEIGRFDVRPRARPWGYGSASYKNPSVPITEFLKAAGLTDEEIRA